jgi:hypothetical protein
VAIEPLLWFCLDHGTSVTEDRIGLSIERRSGETILLFRTDSKAFRERLYDPGARQISCDALFFYKHADKPPLLIFVELKGAYLAHALDQLEATIGAVKPRIERVVGAPARTLALVVSDGARPTTRVNRQREFETRTRVDLRVQTTRRGQRPVDLRAVLRKVDALAPLVAE